MKNSQKGFVSIAVIALVVLVAGGGVGYAYTKDSKVYDRFYSSEKQKVREANRQLKYLPDVLGEYELFEKSLSKVSIDERDCRAVKDPKKMGPNDPSYEICIKTVRAEYHQKGGNKIVFVHLMNVLSNKEFFDTVIGQNKSEVLNSYHVFRPEPHEVAWVAQKRFDYIITQMGTQTVRGEGETSMDYSERATGKDPVTQYFLTTYPPKKNSAANSPSKPATPATSTTSAKPTSVATSSKPSTKIDLITKDFGSLKFNTVLGQEYIEREYKSFPLNKMVSGNAVKYGESGVNAIAIKFKGDTTVVLNEVLAAYTKAGFTYELLSPPAYPPIYKLVQTTNTTNQIALWWSNDVMLIIHGDYIFADGSNQEDILEAYVGKFPSTITPTR